MRSLTSGVVVSALITSCLLFETASSQTKPANKTDTGTVSGRVTVKGKGIPGIVVGLRMGDSRQRARPTLKATTDEDGKYRITNVPPGAYQVAPMAPVFVFFDQSTRGTAGKDLLIAEGEVVEGFDFAIVRGAVITGKVTDAEGRPVIEEFVHLEIEEDPRRNVIGSEGIQTDDRGIYRAFGVKPGKYRVSAGLGDDGFSGGSARAMYRRTYYTDTTDRAQATVVEVAEASEANNIDITVARLPKGVSVSGRVVDGKSGEPVGNVPLDLTKITVDGNSTSHSGGSIRSTNSKGEFRAEGVAPGKYTVSLSQHYGVSGFSQRKNLRSEPVAFDVLDQDITGLLVKTSPGASLEGIVIIESPPQSGGVQKLSTLFVSAFVRDESPYSGYGRHSPVRSDGSFHITGLQAGTVHTAVGANDESGRHRTFTISRIERDGVVQPNGINVENGEQVTGLRIVVTQGTGTIRGTIKIENGTLPPDARIFVSFVNAVETSGIRPPDVDARGHFLATGLTSGNYEIQAHIYLPRLGQSAVSTKYPVTVRDDVVSEVTITIDAKQISRPVP